MTEHERMCRAVCVARGLDPDGKHLGEYGVVRMWEADFIQRDVRIVVALIDILRPLPKT